MPRSIERSMWRAKYDKFCEQWRNEKTYQRLAKENSLALPEGHYELGKKPTFKQWMVAAKNGAFNQQAPIVEKAVEVTDTAWEE